MAGRREVALEVHAHRRRPTRPRRGGEHAVAQEAGVVHDHVEAPNASSAVGDQSLRACPSRRRRRRWRSPRRRRRGSRRRPRRPAARRRVPSSSAPRSLTTTLAPWRANSSACSRPMPRPAPVTMTTRPSQSTRLAYPSPACATGSPCSPPTCRSTCVELARAAEERGFASLYLPEHTHIPTSRRTPPPTGDASSPRSTSARSTRSSRSAGRRGHRTLGVGTGICLAAQREPIVTAKAIATLDPQSGGRFVLGVGFGWNEDELRRPRRRDDGPARRRPRARARHAGAVARRRRPSSTASTSTSRRRGRGPSRRSAGGPPVLIGGAAGPKLFAHIAEYADGWIPIGGAGLTRGPARAAAARARPRPRPGDAADRALRHASRPGSSSTTRHSASPSSCCASRAAIATRCCPGWTATPSSSGRDSGDRRSRRIGIAGGVARRGLHRRRRRGW